MFIKEMMMTFLITVMIKRNCTRNNCNTKTKFMSDYQGGIGKWKYLVKNSRILIPSNSNLF